VSASERSIPRPPRALGRAGRALWRAILTDVPAEYELAARELHILGRACRVADEVDLLERSIDEVGVVVRGSRGQPVLNRALEEVRLARLAEAKLLTLLDLEEREATESPRQQQARRAANARWARRDQLRAVRDGDAA
jgi:hypothetical protein